LFFRKKVFSEEDVRGLLEELRNRVILGQTLTLSLKLGKGSEKQAKLVLKAVSRELRKSENTGTKRKAWE
jgi:hypothetical protein